MQLADQQLAAVALEDEAPALASLAVQLAELTNERLRQRHRPVVLGFGRSRLAARAAALKSNLLPSPVDVAPFDGDLFACARAGLRGEVEQQPIIVIASGLQELVHFLAGKVVPLGIGDLDGGELGEGGEAAPADGVGQALVERREDVAHALVRELGVLEGPAEAGDRLGVDLRDLHRADVRLEVETVVDSPSPGACSACP